MDRGGGPPRGAPLTLASLLAALEAAPLVRVIETTPNVYPVLSAAHVLGIALLLGPILLVDLRLLRVLGPSLDSALPTLERASLAGFALAATTGLALFSVRAGEYAGSPVFRVKLLLIAGAGLNAGVLALARHRARSGRGSPSGARLGVAAAASVALWLGVLLAGRFIAFAP